MSELILVKSSKFPGGNLTESNLVLWGLLLTAVSPGLSLGQGGMGTFG